MQHKDNNLNLLRLIAALMVLYAHSFVFYGNLPVGFLDSTYGSLGVNIFFIVSGYLIVKSWDSTPHVISFLMKRSLRIFPALIIVVLASAFILGPLFTTLTIREYFAQPLTWIYLKNIILYPVFNLPGVFENSKVPGVVNGSLWSLPVEFFMYLMVVTLGLAFKSRRWGYVVATALFAGAVIFWCWHETPLVVIYGTDVQNVFVTGIYFMIGACYAKWRLERWFSLSGACVLILATIMLAPFVASKVLLWFTLPYIVLAYGLSSSWLGTRINRVGDCSYGVYIFAFPVQQVFLYEFPNVSYPLYLGGTIVITLLLGYASWHLVERRMLNFKSRLPGGVSEKESLLVPESGKALNR